MENGFAFTAPGGSVKFKGEDDVAAVADLADEAALGAQVAVVDVVGSELEQRLQEGLKDTISYLPQVSDAVFVGIL